MIIYFFLWEWEWKYYSSLRDRLLVHEGIISAVKRVEFISDRISYITLRGRWCDIVVLNVHAPTEDKNDMKDSFYGKSDQFPKHLTLLGDFNANFGTEDIFKPTIRN
jgi:hypothetical protein